MKLKDILSDGKNTLLKSNIADAEHDAIEILLNLLDMDLARYYFECEDEMEDRYDKNSISNIISEYSNLVSARASHYPLQYILGETYFCGLKFNVDDSVLIPRADTEVLVEKVILDNPDKNKTILDLCTGSGCIAISLACLGNYKIIVGSDISDDALSVASKNAEHLINNNYLDDEMEQQVYFIQSDLFENMFKLNDKLGIEKFDIITANPPYIRSKDIDSLSMEVKKYEPLIALDGSADGLKYYREIAEGTLKYLNDNGKIYIEIGFDQEDDVVKIFKNRGYTHIETVKDLGGNNRVIIFTI